MGNTKRWRRTPRTAGHAAQDPRRQTEGRTQAPIRIWSMLIAGLAAVSAVGWWTAGAAHRVIHAGDWAWQDNRDGTVTDLATSRMWQQGSSDEGLPIQHVQRYCANLLLAGYTDWRPPQHSELESLLSPWRAEGNRCVPGFRNDAKLFWSGTPVGASGYRGWAINCFSGEHWHHDGTSLFRVRCVR